MTVVLYNHEAIVVEQLMGARNHLAHQWEIPAEWIEMKLVPIPQQPGRAVPSLSINAPDDFVKLLLPETRFLKLTDEERKREALAICRYTDGELGARLKDFDDVEREDAEKAKKHDPRKPAEDAR